MRSVVALFCLTFVACNGTPAMMTDASRIDSAGGRDSGRSDDGGSLADSGFDAGSDAGSDSGPPPCTYPEGAVEPMARDEVMWPYRWPEAIDGMGRNFPLDLALVACTADENIDWSPFDVLVFIAIPAW